MFEEILKNFTDIYAGQKPALISRAPGRVELIGGHTDYNQGFIIAAAIDKSCCVAAAKRSDNKICLYSQWAKAKHKFSLSANLSPAEKCQWANYARGVAAILLQEGFELNGANLYIQSEVPVGAGLSSSAALEAALAKAMIQISQFDCQTESVQLAKICQKAENVYANSPCGIMDQIVSVMAKKDNAILLDCRDLSLKFLPFDSKNCCIMIFDSKIQHEIAGSEYRKRRQSCEKARNALSKKFPHMKALRDADKSMLESVKEKIDSITFSRASHVIAENARVLTAADALSKNDMAQFGRLMNQSHCSARDLYEISCEQIDFLAEAVCRCDGSYGARISGGGFGGSVVALAKPEAAETISKNIKVAYERKFNLDCSIYLAHPSQGAKVVELK